MLKLYEGTAGGEDGAFVFAESKEEALEYFNGDSYYRRRKLTLDNVWEADISKGVVFGKYY